MNIIKPCSVHTQKYEELVKTFIILIKKPFETLYHELNRSHQSWTTTSYLKQDQVERKLEDYKQNLKYNE